jgi:hypothetical protein
MGQNTGKRRKIPSILKRAGIFESKLGVETQVPV